MAADGDETQERLIEDFRPRLTMFIRVDEVLEHIHFIEREQREQIAHKAKTEGNLAAAGLLINAVLRRPHSQGWFTVFVDALINGGCQYAADYLQLNLPDPKEEAENDGRVRLIELLSPRLVDMETGVVCAHCFSEGLLTRDDNEAVSTLWGE